MVYCGKASQNCQSCRTRRIKCDKVRPQCTQCVRVGKQCPGYRDQLSLMFRDESTKVIQKAHAQWGVQDPSESGEPSGSSPSSTSPSSTSSRSRNSIAESVSSGPPTSPESNIVAKFPHEISATKIDRAVQFYLEHYVLGHPDEARVGQELQRERWVFSPTTRNVMSAIGLASLANLTGDKDSLVLARQQYGKALKSTAATIQNIQAMDPEVSIRAVIMLGLYEIVRGDGVPTKGAQTHIMGGAALLRGFIPFFASSAEGVRGMLQMCFSMIATVQCSVQQLSFDSNVMIPTEINPSMSEGVIPDSFFDLVNLSHQIVTGPDKPSAELLSHLSRLVQLSAYVRSHPLQDGEEATSQMIRDALEIDDLLGAWEQHQEGIWLVQEEHRDGDFFPRDAVFEGCYHVYADMWTARVWKDFRWARIMASQLLLECVDHFPVSSKPLIPTARQHEARAVCVRVARDTLVSIPSHYRHPRLTLMHRDYFNRTKGGAGVGAAGLPTLLFQIKVAGAAPGVPRYYYDWAVGMMHTIWYDTGMIQAKRLVELLEKLHPASPQRRGSSVFFKTEIP